MLGVKSLLRSRLKDAVWLRVAYDIAALGTCARRKVGAVFVDIHGHVCATGYNGTAPGMEHCIDSPCAGASCAPGTGLELCKAIHAEQNAIAQCRNVHEIETSYSTASPCMTCVKMLATTSAQRVVFAEEYPHPEAKNYWLSLGREWVHIPEGHPSKSLESALGVRTADWLRWIGLAALAGITAALLTISVFAYIYAPSIQP